LVDSFCDNHKKCGTESERVHLETSFWYAGTPSAYLRQVRTSRSSGQRSRLQEHKRHTVASGSASIETQSCSLLTTLIAISDVVSYRSLGHVTLDFIQLFFISPRSHTKSIAANSIWFPVVYRFENASNRQRETFSHRLESTKIIFCFRTELCPRLHWWRLRC